MSSRFSTLSGKSLTLGRGIPQAFPITLDPAAFEGAMVYADNGELRYSDGTNWLTTGTRDWTNCDRALTAQNTSRSKDRQHPPLGSGVD